MKFKKIMPSILNSSFPEADYNYSPSKPKNSPSEERLDTDIEIIENYVPKSKIALADKPSVD